MNIVNFCRKLAQLLWEDRHTEIYYVWILFGHIRIKSTYIITRSHIGEKNNENIHCITENIIEKIEKIKEGKGSDIGLVGGGVLTKTLLRHDLVDEMIIYTVPILLGGGIPLFPPFFPISNWCIEKTELLKNGVMQTTYCKSTL